MTVFIINDGGLEAAKKRDFSAAQKFGEIRLVNKRFVFPHEINDEGHMTGLSFQHISDAAKQFDCWNDYLLPVGDVLQVIQFVALVATKGIRTPIKTLRYDRELKDYYVVSLRQFVAIPTL